MEGWAWGGKHLNKNNVRNEQIDTGRHDMPSSLNLNIDLYEQSIIITSIGTERIPSAITVPRMT
jgi:hypothetical protein